MRTPIAERHFVKYWNTIMKKNAATRLRGLDACGTLGTLGLLIAGPVVAQEAGQFYGGLSVGRSKAKIDDERITANLLGAGLTTTSMTNDDSSTGYKLFGGYQLHRNFAVEGGYFDLGRFGFTSTTLPAGTLDGRIKLRGVNLDLVGRLPLGDRFSVLAKVGGQYAQARDTFSGTGFVNALNPSPKKSELNYKLGLGLQYAFTPDITLRGEAERYRVNDAVGNQGDINFYSLSLVFPFGRAEGPAPRMAAAPQSPMYVAPTPAPAPVVIAAVPPPAVIAPPQRRKVSFSADSLFAFDRSALNPDGKETLGGFARDLNSMSYDQIIVSGHTDRLGSKAHNQRLSLARADAVKDYLVGAGIDAGKIKATGNSGTEPMTKASECKGNKPTPALVACLQPDRRVEAEVTGMR